ncbi:MAG TPA: DUF455 family protein [Acidimicrobiales bacterium]|nr:DUF455 family protein [Acidimicrobiales bacterium]
MSTATYPDRWQRLGGRWSAPGIVDELLRLAALERAVAHVAAGWAPKVPETDDKLRLAHGMEAAMARATALRQQALTLCDRDEDALRAHRAWIEPLRALDLTGDPSSVVEALTVEVPAVLLDRYERLAARIDPLYDARLGAILEAARRELSEPGPARAGDLTEALGRALCSEEPPDVALAAVLWGPVDRVGSPARPAGRRRPEIGARAHFRSTSRLEDEDIAADLGDNVISELCALELMCRNSYEHPDLEWPFHLAMARHASDEARHAAMFQRLLEQRGYDEGTLPQHASNYEYAYSFPECAPGSERELVWRLLILCTVLEGLAIDKLPLEIATRDTLGQYDIAKALDYASADELFHAENGLRWSRILCHKLELDPMIERERVHGRFFGRQRDCRQQYLEADPERARREIEILARPDPDGMAFESRTEVELRRRASFTIEECEQVDRWGYNPAPG